jgi:septation ring formation regulator EzrA
MPVIAFDTYAYVKKLRDANLPEAQASAHAEAIKGLIETNLASKDDIKDIHYELSLINQKLDAEIENNSKEFQRINQEFLAIKENDKEQFSRIDGQFLKVDGQFAKIDGQFAKIDDEFANIRDQFAGVKDEFGNVREEFASIRQEMASKQSINDQKFEQVKTAFARMDAKMSKNHSNMIKWIIAIIMASTTLNISLMKILF